jgi:phenylacetate-coenzyme A ligase PaaK-like adenylate-forming protein
VRAQVTLEDHFHPEVIDPIIGEVLTEGDQVSWCSPP